MFYFFNIDNYFILNNIRDKGNPVLLDDSITLWLKNSGVKRVIAGHQPFGDAPLVIQCRYSVIYIYMYIYNILL
jgi:hypothetical protein